eukprot:366539-Chlamydomonas_euryale.AAC.20
MIQCVAAQMIQCVAAQMKRPRCLPSPPHAPEEQSRHNTLKTPWAAVLSPQRRPGTHHIGEHKGSCLSPSHYRPKRQAPACPTLHTCVRDAPRVYTRGAAARRVAVPSAALHLQPTRHKMGGGRKRRDWPSQRQEDEKNLAVRS